MSSKKQERYNDSGEDVDDVEEEGSVDGGNPIIRPDIFASLQGRDRFLFMQSLPASVKRRIKALKNLQVKATYIEAKFYEEIHQLEYKYHTHYTPLYEKREEIVLGAYEPADEECEFPSDTERETDDESQLNQALQAKVNIQETPETKDAEVCGIPNFWLTIFKNVAMLSDMVHPHDEPILRHLNDIRVIFMPSDPMGFALEFHFATNPYFSNSVLTKEYEMKCKPDESDPFNFEGPEIYRCKGCIIDWYKGQNVTVKTIKKKQKHKSRGSVRTVTKTVQTDSFFNFFSPPYIPKDLEADVDEDTQALLTSDFEIGHYIRERIVPRAVLYYTGEALEDEEDEFDDEEEGEEEEDDQDNDRDRERRNTMAASKSKPGATAPPPECKQQ